jgi:hypothetical protein
LASEEPEDGARNPKTAPITIPIGPPRAAAKAAKVMAPTTPLAFPASGIESQAVTWFQ